MSLLAAQLARQRAAFAPDQPGAQQRDGAIAGQLHKIGDFLHACRRRVERDRQHGHDQHRDHRLQCSGHERDRDSTPQRIVVGEHVGRHHRLAMARPRRVKNAIGETDSKQGPQRRRIRLDGAHGAAKHALKTHLLGHNPCRKTAGGRA